jgi:hypothetical protein
MRMFRDFGFGCDRGDSSCLGLGILAFLLVLSFSLGLSLPVPDTILLPDSLGPLRPA